MKIRIVSLILLGCLGTVVASPEGFNRYQIIIDTHPFGEDPPEPDTVKVKPSQSFARNLRLSMLFEGPGRDVRVGIVDKAAKKNYILSIGDVANGIELIEADIGKSEALLKKGKEVALFKLEEGAVPQKKSARNNRKSRQSSYAERRQALLKKIKDRKKKEEEEEKPPLTGEALRKHLKKVQMDAIRTGKPPLPMPLTKEMDDQLVKEGVLPPQ